MFVRATVCLQALRSLMKKCLHMSGFFLIFILACGLITILSCYWMREVLYTMSVRNEYDIYISNRRRWHRFIKNLLYFRLCCCEIIKVVLIHPWTMILKEKKVNLYSSSEETFTTQHTTELTQTPAVLQGKLRLSVNLRGAVWSQTKCSNQVSSYQQLTYLLIC